MGPGGYLLRESEPMEEPNQPQFVEYPTTSDVLSALLELQEFDPRTPERILIQQVGGARYVAQVHFPDADVFDPYTFTV